MSIRYNSLKEKLKMTDGMLIFPYMLATFFYLHSFAMFFKHFPSHTPFAWPSQRIIQY